MQQTSKTAVLFSPWLLAGLVLLFVLTTPIPGATQTSRTSEKTPVNWWPNVPEVAKEQALIAYGKLPLSFEANQGQADADVKFVARGNGYSLLLSPTESVLGLRPKGRGAMVQVRLLGADPRATMTGLDELPGKANYFIGNSPGRWRTDVPTYGKVRAENVYPGIDLTYYGRQRQLEYDFVVAPGADPRAIALGFQGVNRLEVDGQGDLVLHVAGGELRQQKPLIYQESGGARQTISGRWVLRGQHRAGFEIGDYDPGRPLVVDPVLSYSTFVGGSGLDVAAYSSTRGMAVDAAGYVYVTGRTESANFPTVNPLQPSLRASPSAFVLKLDPSGSALVYSTYLSGSGGYNVGQSLAIDSEGNAYVAGQSSASDFPTTPGAFRTTFNGGSDDAFVAKLNPTGSALLYSTYLGGNSYDHAWGLAVDSAENAYVTGPTGSGNFPTTPGAFRTTRGSGGSQAYVAKLNAAGSALVYSTFLASNGDDAPHGIAVDSEGNAYISGETNASNFPTTPGAFRTTYSGGYDAFVTKLNPSGSALIYSTYLGGSGYYESGASIAVDASGNAFVAGNTTSVNFPVTPGAFQTASDGSDNCFVVKLNPAGSALVYATYLGGSGRDGGWGIAVNAAGNAYVTGLTASTNFPTTPDALRSSYGGGPFDGFLAILDPAGSTLLFSTYLGGSGDDRGNSIAVDAAGNAYVTGDTGSTNFLTTPGAFQTNYGGGPYDVFIAKITGLPGADTTPPVIVPTVTPAPNAAGWNNTDVTITWSVTDPESGITTSSGCESTTLASDTTGTTLTCSATNGAGLTNSESVTAKLDKAPPLVTPTVTPAPDGAGWNNTDVTVSWSVTDPDSGITISSGCESITLTNDTPGTTLTCTATNGAGLSNFNSVTVKIKKPIAVSIPGARAWIGLRNSDDIGIRFDLRAEAYRNGTQLVALGEVASVKGGSSGFNNANLYQVPMTGGASFFPGDTLAFVLLVRNACSGSGKNSGGARLWYGDTSANSGFDVTAGNSLNYYLLGNSALATSPGAARLTLDVGAGAKCSGYKVFSNWSTVPVP